MLQPKKPKFRKQFKGRMHGNSKEEIYSTLVLLASKLLHRLELHLDKLKQQEDAYQDILKDQVGYG